LVIVRELDIPMIRSQSSKLLLAFTHMSSRYKMIAAFVPIVPKHGTSEHGVLQQIEASQRATCRAEPRAGGHCSSVG
jgi:hypothetical protein